MRRSRLLILTVALLGTPAARADGPVAVPGWAHEGSDIPVSPRVTFGRLDNGLRYAVAPVRTPRGQLSVRLLVLAGSLYERDDQLGYAHFIEHMAFRSTRSFHADEKVRFLQGLGVTFGPHINAETNFTHTLYRLDLPQNSPEVVASVLKILRDFADGVAFEPAEVDRERGVILSEAQAGHTPGHNRDVARFDYIYAGTRIPQRWPIGTETSVKRAGSRGLREFYDAWYRPERMVVLVAGDIDPPAVAGLIESTFASLEDRSPRRPVPKVDGLSLPGPVSARFFSDPRNGIQVELGTVRAELPLPDTEKNRIAALSLDMALDMLDRRLRRLTDAPAKPISAAAVNNERPFSRLRQLSLVTVGDIARWPTVVATAEQELRRAIVHGFDASELAVERESMRAAAREEALAVATASPAKLADGLLRSVEQGDVFTLPDERLARVVQNVGQATEESCRVALRDAWSGSPRFLFVTAHAHLIKLSSDQILGAYQASAAVAVAAPSALKPVTFGYDDFGPPGPVVERTHLADLDLWLVRFANGVRLNVKHTDLERGQVRMDLRLGTGRLDEPPDKPGLFFWAGAALGAGGLRRYTDDELDRALGGIHLDINMGTASDGFAIAGSSASDQFPLLLRRITANLTDAAFRADADKRLAGYRSDLYLNLETSAEGPILQEINPFLAGGDRRVGIPKRATAQGYTMAVLASALAPILRSGRIEMALVGDIDVDRAIAVVAATLGALPPRGEAPVPADRTTLTFPVPPQSRGYTYRTGAKDRPTTLVLCWPVNERLSVGERRHLEILAYVLQERLRVRIRVEKGETYSPNAAFVRDPAYPGLAHLECRLDVKPARANEVGDAVRDLAVSLGSEGVAPDELERAKAQRLADVRRLRSDNAYWLLEVLSEAQEHPWRIDEARGLEQGVTSVTAPEVDALAARFLTSENLFRFEIRPVYTSGLTLFDRLK
jgi:zinc protease